MDRRVARKVRVEDSGGVYHVMNRGGRREAIFGKDADRELFLSTLGEAWQKTDWQVHGYCLMGDHFQLVVETPRGNLVAGMPWFLGTYTGRFNRWHRLSGHLFANGDRTGEAAQGRQDGAAPHGDRSQPVQSVVGTATERKVVSMCGTDPCFRQTAGTERTPDISV